MYLQWASVVAASWISTKLVLEIDLTPILLAERNLCKSKYESGTVRDSALHLHFPVQTDRRSAWRLDRELFDWSSYGKHTSVWEHSTRECFSADENTAAKLDLPGDIHQVRTHEPAILPVLQPEERVVRFTKFVLVRTRNIRRRSSRAILFGPHRSVPQKGQNANY